MSSRPPKLGATGRFPQGKLNEHDKGELQFSISIEGSEIRIDFGRPVAWFGLPPHSARQLALLLIDKAAKIDGGGEA